MTDNKELKELYKKCYDDKWDCDNDNIDIAEQCAFCHDTRDKDDDISCSVDGHNCEDICLIDKNICGSEYSLMVILDNLTSSEDVDRDKIDEAFNNIREALREHM